MASYFVKTAQKDLTGKIVDKLGTLGSFLVDGRLSPANAEAVARETIERQQGDRYIGFFIKKADRWPDYTDRDYRI